MLLVARVDKTVYVMTGTADLRRMSR